MVVRIWKTGLDETRQDEYRRFERDRSLPMFQQQPGFLAVLFLRQPGGAAALTVWESMEDVNRLADSPSYRETVEQLLATGLLRGGQTVELMEVASLDLAGLARS